MQITVVATGSLMRRIVKLLQTTTSRYWSYMCTYIWCIPQCEKGFNLLFSCMWY